MLPDHAWNEETLSEALAVALLERLGYRALAPTALEAERASASEVVLVNRLETALRKLNPGLSDDNVCKAIRAVTHTQAASLIEANRDLYTILTLGNSFEEDRGDGCRSHSVRYFDFEHPYDNDLVVAREYSIEGEQRTIRLDLVVFVNGIPLVVIECKSPTLGDLWKAGAIQQLRHYQDFGDGGRRLFGTIQVLVASCGRAAVYGTVGTPERFFAEWRDPFPRTIAKIEQMLGRKASAQDILVYGLLAPENLLDIIRNFVVFEDAPASGGLIKTLARHHQFRAVNASLARISGAKATAERGGIIWHAQGSGKRLTMLWLALKLKRDGRYQNPTIVVVTDRLALEEQIAATFRRYGLHDVVTAESSAHLRELLADSTGVIVTTTIHKFGKLADDMHVQGEVAAINNSSDLFVLVEEAHRTQYGSFASKMRAALPNACLIGLTGTPIDRKDRSTLHAFGSYIDTYTFRESVSDGTTVPIFFERRLPKLRVVETAVRDGEDRSKVEREDVEQEYESADKNAVAIAGAPQRIEAICVDLVEHYRKVIQPDGFKALIVAVSRRVAIAYKETLERLNAPESAVLISGTVRDAYPIAQHVMGESQREQTINRFLDPKDPLSMLVVCEMLLTGFDAPILQVLYLDAPLKAHTLLQAVARVNRTAEGKGYGLVVDYWGVFNKLQEALEIFSFTDVKETMVPKSDELPRLQGRHAAVLRFFLRVADKDDLNACVIVLKPEAMRAEFELSFRRFAQSLDVMLPDPRALSYVDDLRWVAKIRKAASARFLDEALDVSDFGTKVRSLIEEAIIADSTRILVQPP